MAAIDDLERVLIQQAAQQAVLRSIVRSLPGALHDRVRAVAVSIGRETGDASRLHERQQVDLVDQVDSYFWPDTERSPL